MKRLLLALAAPLALSTPALANDDYNAGLRAGGTIVTCEYLKNGRLNADFGVYMVKEQFRTMSHSQQEMLLGLWRNDGADICIRATNQR